MIKISDAHDFVQKKITRNKLLMEIFQGYGKMLENEIRIKTHAKDFYLAQSAILIKVNEIELLQSSEYTVEREKEIAQLIENIGIYEIPEESKQLTEETNTIKTDIKYKSETIQYLQTLIPKEGIATNYKVVMNNPNQTCADAVRNIK